MNTVYLLVPLLSWLIHALFILLCVAFFTLFERKVIGLIHNRLGPNNVSFMGLLQPLLDAFKLLSNQTLTPLRSNKLVYNLAPQSALFFCLFIWLTFPTSFLLFSLNYSFVIFFCIGSVIVFSVLLAGWSSNSKYSLIGSLRSVAQSISYESVFGTLLILLVYLIFSFSSRSFFSFSSPLFILIFPIWFICVLAETHRAPFDFSESESELVSGFNTEYSGAYFAFIFLSEYGVLLFSCSMISIIFFSWLLPPSSVLWLAVLSLFFSFLTILVRTSYCRFRYDLLMILGWKRLLPISMLLLISLSFLPIVYSCIICT